MWSCKMPQWMWWLFVLHATSGPAVVESKSPVQLSPTHGRDSFVVASSTGTPLYSSFGSSTSSRPQTRSFPYSSSDSESAVKYERRTLSDFATRDSRVSFMRKVYSIFAAQMACTIGITAVIMNNEDLRYFLYRNVKPFLIISYLASFGVITALVTQPELRYRPPTNFLLLGLHTVLQSTMVGIFSSLMGPRLVCLGTVHTLATFLAITLYSFQPNEKLDLTPLGNLLLTSLTSLTVGSLLNHFFRMPLVDNLISGAMAVVFATYLAYDTQKIVGGKHHKHAYSPKEYILAALNLYQDIISLFMHIVSILDKMEKSKKRRRS